MKATCPRCKRRVRLKKSRNIVCKCGFTFRYSDYFGNEKIFLVDANVIIFAVNDDKSHGNDCKQVLRRNDIAITDKILDEIHNEIKYRFIIYEVKDISEEVKELSTNFLKQPSKKDLSLIQAAIDHPEIYGIITYDNDFKNLATSGFIKSKTPKEDSVFFVGNAKEFLAKYG